MKCPKCGHVHFSYDSFEDMYCCTQCHNLWYPVEIGAIEQPLAGYRHIGIKPA